MAKDNHIIIDIPEAQLDFSNSSWKESVKKDFKEVQKSLESNPDPNSPAYYTWFWFFMKYGRILCSEEGKNYLKSNNLTPFTFVKDIVGLTMSGGGAYTIGYKFFEECLKNNPEIDVCGIKIHRTKEFTKTVSDGSIKDISNSKYRPYITAIKSKPFLLLAGISGTGKSRIVRELARACWDVNSDEYTAQKPRNFEMIQVKPNWHDSSELIGYVSRISGEKFVVGPFLKFIVKAMQEPDVPYFLCLDEMNLAPVEQYFAEYLSVIESRKAQDGTVTTDPIIDYEQTDAYKSLIDQLFAEDDNERKAFLTKEGGKRLTIPQNLIVVGTVNMDETTFSFSRKVLDRAMTIEMNEVDLYGGLTNQYEQIGKLGKNELIGNAVEGVDVYDSYKEVCNKAIKYLDAVNSILEGTPFKVAYRTRNEFLLYVVNNLPYNQDEDGKALPQEFVIARALDEITNMKILTRIEGDETKVSDDFLKSISETIKSGLENIYAGAFADDSDNKINSVSLAKIKEMRNRLKSGYTSFWS